MTTGADRDGPPVFKWTARASLPDELLALDSEALVQTRGGERADDDQADDDGVTRFTTRFTTTAGLLRGEWKARVDRQARDLFTVAEVVAILCTEARPGASLEDMERRIEAAIEAGKLTALAPDAELSAAPDDPTRLHHHLLRVEDVDRWLEVHERAPFRFPRSSAGDLEAGRAQTSTPSSSAARKSVAADMNDKKHARHREASARVAIEWRQCSLRGMTKDEAAPHIARRVNLSARTVRDKLKSL